MSWTEWTLLAAVSVSTAANALQLRSTLQARRARRIETPPAPAVMPADVANAAARREYGHGPFMLYTREDVEACPRKPGESWETWDNRMCAERHFRPAATA